jgi:xanthine/uracil/vitamin C permease (AzgA family)
MMRQIVSVNWRYIGDAVPAFVTVMFIPFGYSVSLNPALSVHPVSTLAMLVGIPLM